MGAIYNEMQVPYMSREELRQHFTDVCNESGYNDGMGGYSGGWVEKRGMLDIRAERFKSVKAAAEYVLEHNDKSGPAVAVLVGTPPELFDNTATGRSLRQRFDKLRKELEDFEPGIVRRARAGKSKTRGCKHCGSSIAVAALRPEFPATLLPDGFEGRITGPLTRSSLLLCPVCGRDFLVTETDKKRRKSLEERLEKAREAYAEARRKYDQRHKGQALWYIGGDCSY